VKTSCWIITENLIGTQNQCVALARAANFDYELKTIRLRQPWRTLTPWMAHFSPRALGAGSASLAAPWPDVIIASGRKAIVPALWVKKQSQNKTKLIVIQNPVLRHAAIDLIVAPRHDRVKGHNVVEITGALSIITPDILAAAKEEWRATFETLSGPRVAVLIGGNSRTHTMTDVTAHELTDQLRALAQTHALMITASRRTPEKYRDFIYQTLSRHCGLDPQSSGNFSQGFRLGGRNDKKGIFFWDGTGDNPYRGMLAWADALLVTEDSVSMACEAVSTGKPVYIIPMMGGSARFRRFHAHLYQNHYARPFKGHMESWTYTPPDDLAHAADAAQSLGFKTPIC
jgi:mitochondrial fission protein ELM1